MSGAELLLLLPEIALLAGACLVLLAPAAAAWPLTALTLAAAAALTLGTAPAAPATALAGAFERAAALDALRALICLLAGLALHYARGCGRADARLASNEFYALALFGCLGMFLLSAATHLIALYLGLEILALSLYPMVALARGDGRGAEAALKYFVLGALASGLLLYGLSLLYAATGTLHLETLGARLAPAPVDGLLLLGLVFALAGLAFKLGAVPFHMWLPDVYDGAPLPAAAYLSAAPKIAVLLLALRLFGDGLAPLAGDWTVLMAALALLSLLLGNLVALAQTRVRRMLAYSAIAHTGFVLLALAAGGADGFAAAVFYTLVYALAAAGAFGLLLLLNHRVEAEELADLRGLNRRHPWFALLMLVLMLSLAGVPLTAGFTAKLYVLQAALDAGLLELAVAAVLLTVVGAYYYLRVVWYMYFEEPPEPAPEPGPGPLRRGVLSANALALVVLFALPGSWLELSREVAALFPVGG